MEFQEHPVGKPPRISDMQWGLGNGQLLMDGKSSARDSRLVQDDTVNPWLGSHSKFIVWRGVRKARVMEPRPWCHQYNSLLNSSQDNTKLGPVQLEKVRNGKFWLTHFSCGA